MSDITFGYNPRQLNLMAIRIQQTLAEHSPSLINIEEVKLNVALDDEETLDMPIYPMSAEVLVAFVVSLLAANNAALTDQLRSLGLEPPLAPDIQPIERP